MEELLEIIVGDNGTIFHLETLEKSRHEDAEQFLELAVEELTLDTIINNSTVSKAVSKKAYKKEVKFWTIDKSLKSLAFSICRYNSIFGTTYTVLDRNKIKKLLK